MLMIRDFSNRFQQISGMPINGKGGKNTLKKAGIDTSSKQYRAVMRSMSAACSGVGYTNVQAIKNRMSRYDKDGDYISPVTGLAGTEKNLAEKNRIIDIPESSREYTLRQYERAYTQAFVDAVKAADPKWEPGKPIPSGALDGTTRESIDNSLVKSGGSLVKKASLNCTLDIQI